MSKYQSVVWSEGMFLAPQHFQQWDRNQEVWLSERLQQLFRHAWGFCELDIDGDALAGGRLVLTRAHGLLPDGTPFRAPDFDELPEGRVIGAHFAPGAPFLEVYLSYPEHRVGSANLGQGSSENARDARLLPQTISVPDTNTGASDREITVGSKNLRLLFGDEVLDGFSVLPVVRLEKGAAGTLSLVENFVPPCVSIGASPYLMRLMRRLVEMLSARSTSLAAARRQRGAGAMEFGVSDITAFWLLHTVNSVLPLLNHALMAKPHPELCYQWLVQLSGQLMTFLPTGHPTDLPLYQHDNLAATFDALELVVRQGLETVLPSNFVAIPLEKVREGVWLGRVRDERLLDAAKFYLAIGGDVPERGIGELIPQKVKIGSPTTIDGLIGAALRGVNLTHLTWVPSAVPARAGYHYFQLNTASELWGDIRLAKAISIYLPAEFSQAKMDLIAVRE
jgi:type VI secretion system protein ImpJ